ncbi:hypothetical protein C2R22_02140 [Salinigranum rubrum]|uniref:Uncharacterized protein n=1 Tax=Salinigranum rubrum TaxID=755307 RepID=A0A2I8VFB6_9EURY|nr:DUF6775 family putative metallopeptidase [Salinigranum rubrum]AUV80605.1 hypothetical protein C2R22_02140 [Salinigranum rubrum]
MAEVDTVVCYRAPTTVADTPEIAAWLRERLDARVEIRDRFLDSHADEDLAEAFAAARVHSPHERGTGTTMLGAVRYEERALDDPERAGGVLYDGRAVQGALNARLPDAESSLSTLHVVLVDRTLATWGDHDGRWHKRVTVLGQPALVSVPGLYEAPAKPEAYYQAKQEHALLSGDAPPREVLESAVDGDFLVDDDPRTTEALKGYVLQAVDYVETGEAFCDAESCRLANPHRQPGVVRAQLRSPEFCDRHAARYGVSDRATDSDRATEHDKL